MAKTEIAKSAETAASRPRDMFSAMRDEMDKVFQHFERGFPRWPTLFQQGSPMLVPELDVLQQQLPDVRQRSHQPAH